MVGLGRVSHSLARLLVPCEGQMPRNALVSSEQSLLDATLLSRSFSKMLTTGRLFSAL